jgi:hypothetical protein
MEVVSVGEEKRVSEREERVLCFVNEGEGR